MRGHNDLQAIYNGIGVVWYDAMHYKLQVAGHLGRSDRRACYDTPVTLIQGGRLWTAGSEEAN